MSYVFSDSERSAIVQAANICDGMIFNVEAEEYRAVPVEGQSCALLYRLLSSILGERLFAGSVSRKR